MDTYMREQYEFSNHHKIVMVLLPEWLCQVRLNGFIPS